MPANTSTMRCCQEEFRSWTAAHPQPFIPFISLLPLRWGRNCQHAILTQPVLTNLIRTSLIRPCCLAVLGQLHRSCSLLQSLCQNKIVVLQSLLHKVAYETLSRCTENTPHCQCWVHRDRGVFQGFENKRGVNCSEGWSRPHIFCTIHPAGKLQPSYNLFALCSIKWYVSGL